MIKDSGEKFDRVTEKNQRLISDIISFSPGEEWIKKKSVFFSLHNRVFVSCQWRSRSRLEFLRKITRVPLQVGTFCWVWNLEIGIGFRWGFRFVEIPLMTYWPAENDDWSLLKLTRVTVLLTLLFYRDGWKVFNAISITKLKIQYLSVVPTMVRQIFCW